MAMPSAMGAAHSTPSMPMESGNVTASGIKNKTSRKTEATTARTGLPAAWKNSDVIFTEQVNVTNIRNMRNVLTAKSLYSTGSEYLGAPNMPTTASGASSNNSVATSPIATVHSRI